MDWCTPGFPSITNSWSLLKLISIESLMPSNHLILCRPLLLLSIFPSIKVLSSELALPIRWSKYWSLSFIISPCNEYSGLISFRMDWLDLLAAQGTLKSLLQHHSSKASILWQSAFFMVQLLYPYMPRKCTGCSKHPLPTTQEKTLHMDITRWSTPKSDWLYSLQQKMEKLYTVNKNKTRSWLWLRSWTPYYQIQT